MTFPNWRQYIIIALLGYAVFPAKLFSNPETVQITSDNLRIENEQKKAFFTGNVNARLNRIQFFCQKMVIQYTEKGDLLSVSAMGNVKVSQDNATATAQKARLNVKKNILILTGKPILKKGDNQLSGQRMEIDLKSGRIQIFKARGTFKFGSSDMIQSLR
jgi:lipopolysaccharide export system protein LptA